MQRNLLRPPFPSSCFPWRARARCEILETPSSCASPRAATHPVHDYVICRSTRTRSMGAALTLPPPPPPPSRRPPPSPPLCRYYEARATRCVRERHEHKTLLLHKVLVLVATFLVWRTPSFAGTFCRGAPSLCHHPLLWTLTSRDPPPPSSLTVFGTSGLQTCSLSASCSQRRARLKCQHVRSFRAGDPPVVCRRNPVFADA